MNRVFLVGRLTADPRIGSTKNGKTYANFCLAVDRRLTREAAAVATQTTDFIWVTAWDRRADFAQNYLKKGTKIIFEGRISTVSTPKEDGQGNKYSVSIVADNIEFAESKRTGQSAADMQEMPISDANEDIPF